MSNRRSLIGEVSLPKISEKVWNRINVELFDNTMGRSYGITVNIDYVVSEDIRITVYLSDDNFYPISYLMGTNHTSFETGMGSSQGVTVTSWTPLEDDNYKYIVFPMHLEVGDNGDKGKVLYEYLMWIIDVNSTHLDETDIIWIDGNKAGNPEYFYQWFPIIKNGYIEFSNASLTHYKLYPSGLIQKYSQSGGMP